MASTLIKDAFLATSKDRGRYDIFLQNGKILAIGLGVGAHHADEVIPAKGLTLLPGVLDTHVHFREPGGTHKESLESGSKAAAAGGVTTFFDMPNTSPSTTTLETMAAKKALAAQSSFVNYGFFMGATSDNLEVLNTVPQVAGIKIYVGSSTGSLLVSGPEALDQIFANGDRLIAVHSEDEAMIQENQSRLGDQASVYDHGLIRSPEAALKATQQLIRLAKKYQRRLHIVHVTTAEEVAYLRDHKIPGLITAEACPHHLFLNTPTVYDQFGTLAKVNPPIRDGKHAEALWQGLLDGTLDFVASDHAPHTLDEKNQSYLKAPSGMPGVQTLLPLLLNQVASNKCSLKQVVDWACTQPASAYGVKNKGAIQLGYDADLVLVDLKKTQSVTRAQSYSKSEWSCFEGCKLQGWPVMTFVNGVKVCEHGVICADEPVGRPVVFEDRTQPCHTPHPEEAKL